VTIKRALPYSILVGAVALAALAANASDIADAAMRGDVAALRSLLERNVDVNEPQADGATALHWAAYAGDVENVRLLVAAGADVTARNRAGVTPMFLATTSGEVEIIEMLLDAGVDVNERGPNGETPLMMAARTGRAAPIELLISRGADLDAMEPQRGTTALMWAAAYSNPEAVEALLDGGADYSLPSANSRRGRRPYLAPTAKARIASYYRGTGQAGTSVSVDLDGDGVADVTNERAVDPDEFEARLVEESARFEEEGIQSADAPVVDLDLPPPTATAVDDNDDNFQIQFGRDGEELEDWGGLTALVFAAREGDIESARLLLDAGADVNQTTEYGWTPLLAATQNRYYQLGALLLERGADPNIQNDGGWSPLYIATDNRNIEGGDYPTREPDMDHLAYIDLLLGAGADVNVRMNSSTETRTIFTHQWLYEEGATPFLRAAQSSDTVLMRRLLDHGADPDIATYAGVTPLMVAAGIGWVEGVTFEWSREQNVEAIDMLLELGADVNARATEDADGRTALMGAAHKGRNEVVEILVDHGADLAARDIGSRDSIHKLLGKTWQAIDYADGLVRVGVQSAIAHPETAALIRELMLERGLEVPPDGRTLDSICVTEICR
jgi:ankyrin repeat protein